VGTLGEGGCGWRLVEGEEDGGREGRRIEGKMEGEVRRVRGYRVQDD